MKYTLIRNKKDKSMIELWHYVNNRGYLAAVIHEDMFDGYLNEEVIDSNEVEIILAIKGDK